MTGRGGQPIVLGIDVGTTDTKALAATPEGRPLGIGRCPTAWHVLRDGGAETTADALLDGAISACLDAVDLARAQLGEVHVAGIGVTGMAESGVLRRPDGGTDHPVIAWHDPRGAAEAAALPADFAAAFPARTGLPLGPLATFSKLLWLVGDRGIRWEGLRWLNVAEHIVAALGGDLVTEPSLASRTGLTDQDTLTPYEDALAVLGAPLDLLPPLRPAGMPAGRVTRGPEVLHGAVLTVAGHDHPVASLAAGALGEEDLFDSCGTAEALLRITPKVVTAEQRVQLSAVHVTQGAHVLPGRRVLLGGTRGGQLLGRTLALLGAREPEARAALDRACPTGEVALAVRVEGGRLDEQGMVLHVDADDVSPGQVWRAALEHVADQAVALAEIFESVVGPASRTVAAGGWMRMASYRAVKAQRFPGVVVSQVEQAGASGAAMVAAFAVRDEPDTRALPDVVAGLLPAISG